MTAWCFSWNWNCGKKKGDILPLSKCSTSNESGVQHVTSLLSFKLSQSNRCFFTNKNVHKSLLFLKAFTPLMPDAGYRGKKPARIICI